MSPKLFVLAATSVFAAFAPVVAQPGPTPSMMKKFNDWGVYSYQAGNAGTCYVLTMARDELPANVQHGDNYFLIAPKPSGAGYYPQAVMGYELKEGSPMTVTINGEAYLFKPKGNSGWTAHEDRDPALIAAMRSGRSMTLEAVSKRGTQTSYTFSLSGITAALNEAKRCR